MIEHLFTIVYFVVVAALASVASLSITSRINWRKESIGVGIPVAFAAVAAPFLLGLLSVLVLALLPGKPHWLHLSVIVALMALMVPWGSRKRQATFFQARPFRQITENYWAGWLLSVLVLWVGMLILNSLALPLRQNDALEYATVGAILYDARDLAAYPAIHPQETRSGFFGPWTHPPLYVSLIYLSYILQGSADYPGVMRLISPWFYFASTFLVYTLGAMSGRLIGLLSAAFMASTPLFFLGADSALIDALPIAGTAMVIAAITCQHGASGRDVVLQGAVLGVALWAHSQSILLIPLFFATYFIFHGWKNTTSSWIRLFTLLITAVLIGGWPYYRNMLIFGYPISDNPAVFAMKELAFDEYFSVTRGLSHWGAKLQYGLFKGWLAFEAFGILFWLMTIGIAAYGMRLFRAGLFTELLALRGVPFNRESWIIVPLSFIAVYLAGVAVSIVLGSDLMIKNERYLLLILPAVSIVAGYGVSRYFLRAKPLNLPLGLYCQLGKFTYPDRWKSIFILSVFFFQLLVVAGFYRWYHYLKPTSDTASEYTEELNSSGQISSLDYHHYEKLMIWPSYGVVNYIKNSTLGDSLVLSMRPSDMYYSERKMISYLDPRMIPLYKESDLDSLHSKLLGLGIDYIHVPDYSIPPLYNSMLQSYVSDFRYSKLMAYYDGHAIYKLNKEEKGFRVHTVDLSPGKIPWTKLTAINLGGRKRFSKIGLKASVFNASDYVSYSIGTPFFHREISVSLLSGHKSAVNDQFPFGGMVDVDSDSEYQIELHLKGEGHAFIWFVEVDSRGELLGGRFKRTDLYRKMGELPLSDINELNVYKRRIMTLPEARYLRVMVEHVGLSKMMVSSAKLHKVEYEEGL